MSDDDKFIITADEATGLLDDGDYVHNLRQSGFLSLGCDVGREAAIKAFHDAELIEIGGPSCKAVRHPIVVHEKDGRYSFFAADMAKVDALEASRAALSKATGAS